MKTNVHQNSIATYHALEVKLSARAQAVLNWITEHGPHTDRQVAYAMGFGENLNAVRPRITELIGLKKLMEVCTVTCPVTKRPVRKVDIVTPRGPVRLFS